MTDHDDHHLPEVGDVEAPEADALDQAMAAFPDADEAPVRMTSDGEAPEADALEQAMAVPPPLDEYTDHDA